jgi:hypothetical protein
VILEFGVISVSCNTSMPPEGNKKGYDQHDLPSCGSVMSVLMRWGFMYSQFNLSINVQCTDLW